MEALSSEPVGENRLANEIHTKYCSSLDEQESENAESEKAGIYMYTELGIYSYMVCSISGGR